MYKFTRPLGPNSSIANQTISIQTATTILAANIRRQTKMFLKRRVKSKPLQYRETSSNPRTFQARNTTYERKINLQHCETSQAPEEPFFDKITFLDKDTFLEDQTVIHTNIFSNTYSLRRLKNALSGDVKIALEGMLDSYHTSHVSREHIADFKAGQNQVENDTGNRRRRRVAAAYRKINGDEAATRRQLLGGEQTVAGHGGSGERWSETAASGRNARWLRRTATARAFHARAEAKLREALAASSGLRLRRGWCLRLHLDERNTMVEVMGDLLNGNETELKACGFRRLPRVLIGGDELNVITAYGCSGDELRRPTHCKMITLLLLSSLSL
uniref:Uncharacterized protein n=1 Tax=Brassica oleracea var. oleracea TaxID=109376 RepID=A0A0D3AB12_BRAOL